MRRLYDIVRDVTELEAKEPGFQGVMYRYKSWPQDQVNRHDNYLKDRLPDCDMFFASSMAAEAGLSERTFRTYLRTDPTLGFVHRLKSGEVATHSNSIGAWAESRSQTDGRKNITTWHENFAREIHVTVVGTGSVAMDSAVKK